MDHLWQDLRYALRGLRRRPSVTILATGSLALAIAGNATVFSLINGLLYRPLPYHEPHRIALIRERAEDAPRGQLGPASAANFLDWQQRQQSFLALAAFRPISLGLEGGSAEPEPLAAGAVTPEFFTLLGAGTAVGRVLVPEEGQPGRDRVTLLSHRLWVERFAARSDVVGETLKLDGELYEVVGVLAPDFEFLNPNLRLYVPLVLDRAALRRHQRDLFAVARLRPGVSNAEAQAELTAIMQQLTAEYPEANRGYAVDVLNLREELPDSRNRRLLGLMQGALIFVLLIACANVANLLLAASQSREREIAVRTSLGASRRRIMRQLFTESLLMALIAAGLGLALTAGGVRALATALASQLPRVYYPVIDFRVLLFTLGVTLVGGLLFGLAPVVRTSRFDLLGALKDGAQAATAGPRRRLAANALVVAEIALALVLLGGTSVLIRSFLTIQTTDPGFVTENLLTVQLSLPESRYGSDEELVRGLEQLVERLGVLPGVSGVAAANLLPRTPFVTEDTFLIDAQPPAAGQSPPRTGWLAVHPGYFTTLGIPLRRGRLIAAADRTAAPAVAVVNQAMARRYWGDADPVGQRLTIGGRSREIVGVVDNVRHGLQVSDELPPMVYLPAAQQALRNPSLALRTRTEPATLAAAVRREISAFDAELAIGEVLPLEVFLARFYVGMQVFTAILGGFGTLALLLAALGTYGVLSYSVAQRSHEIGVRMALGAGRLRVVRMIARQGLTLAAIGLGCGVPGVVGVTRMISGLTTGIVPTEPLTVVWVGLGLALVSLAASALPARQAASVDPIVALRWE